MNEHVKARFARIAALEVGLAKRIRIALLRELEVLVHVWVTTGSVDVVAANVSSTALKTVLNTMYLQVIQQEAKHEYLHLLGEQKAKPVLPIAEWLRFAKRFLQVESSKAIVAITATTRTKVREVLKEAADAGKGIAETAKDMRTSITSFNTRRSKRIARTELLGSVNYGSYIGAIATGLPLDKIWLATGGGRTRDTHNAASGQQVDINGLFVVGGLECRFPADPALSARERVNCRCTIIYKPRPKLVQGSFDF